MSQRIGRADVERGVAGHPVTIPVLVAVIAFERTHWCVVHFAVDTELFGYVEAVATRLHFLDIA